VDFLSVFDVTNQGKAGEVYESFDLATNNLSQARDAIQDQLGLYAFQFVNATSQTLINQNQEGKVKLKLAFDAPGGVPRILIRSS